jgi:hypothetical protein
MAPHDFIFFYSPIQYVAHLFILKDFSQTERGIE